MKIMAAALCVALVTGCGARSGIDAADPLAEDAGDALGSDGAPIDTDFAGVFACKSSVSSVYRADGMTFYYAGGRSGTLQITSADGTLTTSCGGDPFASGSLEFVATSHGSANPVGAGQSLQVIACTQQKDVANLLDIESGSLTLDGSTVILSLAGTMDASSACAGAAVIVSFTCTRS